MQVKKFEASSVIEALQQVKKELGPDAIILQTQEAKRSVTGAKKYIVVAAVSEHHLRKKELAEQQLGQLFENKVQSQSAQRQKQFIESVYQGVEKKHEARQRRITSTPYIDIDDGQSEAEVPAITGNVARASQMEVAQTPLASAPVESGATRVQQAAREAFKTSLTSQFFAKEKPEPKPQASIVPLKTVQQQMSPITAVSADEVPAAISGTIKKLKACGVDADICRRLTETCKKELGNNGHRQAIVDSWFAKWILNEVQVVAEADEKDIELFVGPHGSGKTTALVKLAAHYVVNEQKQVAIVTTDLHKVGAVEQLRVYSRILNVPVFVVPNATDLEQKLNDLDGFDRIFVDTPGISLSSINELDDMRTIAHLQANRSHRIHLVISALTKVNDMGGILKRFRVSNFDDVIVTNIDQTSQHGILMNIQEKIAKPFHSFGIGSDVVDGFEFASRERVLDLIFKLTKRSGERGNDSRI